ncbi:substrate-binding domain-containing protein [Albimonas sp. CAU 1670]|uniref:substrate-binding domain-containing protein n=1 Tax=Albimonas sp. CAU 1670 TaxID=3032599 RepID=UPI0023DAEE48|nr:substrate-binding domain-containing protein [Albimonas sp. CAU 1670]MDF2235469.1 substrate-binding domain-containing protein [Albimonas sp. CAU 1670]
MTAVQPAVLFGPVAVRILLGEVAARFRNETGEAVELRLDLNPAVAERIRGGEAYDLGITNPEHAAPLFADGLAAPESHRPLGAAPLAVARRSGTGGEVAREAAALADLLRGAASVGYTAPGTSGKTFLAALARLGMEGASDPRFRPMGGGEPAAATAAGETELAVAPLTTVLSYPGLELAGVFPEAVVPAIRMSMFLAPGAADARPAAARLQDFLADPALDPWLEARGLHRFALD